ncbi:hypothetical protein CK203_095412 [Vitis vinifera]|uniref:Integrase catalytic domain-containing protein n=1 Tax=Vitis vinifera TaxID=29760 RepID=A0A438CW39_VITVI|nr:hypothetical protein CK203_095412 [Vitis vinifera]
MTRIHPSVASHQLNILPSSRTVRQKLRRFHPDRKADATGWTDDCQSTLKKIKHYLTQPPILSSPQPGERLYVYLAVSDWAVNVVLVCCPTHKEQKPVYYVSRAMADSETRYSKIEQTALALRSATQKLRPYFQAHPIVILIDQPLRRILHKPDLLLETGNRTRRSGGPYESTEPLSRQDPKWDCCYNLQLANNWSKPSGWDFLHRTMKPSPYLRCLDHSEAQYVLAELHEGVCSNHPRGRSLAHRAHSQGIPQAIIADNGPQFDSIAFRNFCSELKIQNLYSTPRYPQSNGQVEATNKTLLRPNGNTHFALAYGMDVVIPTEIGLPTTRTAIRGQKNENLELKRNLDWADEVRENASIRMAVYQQRVAAHYNHKVRSRVFKVGTLVLKKVFENIVEKGAGKFQANWESPYIVF